MSRNYPRFLLSVSYNVKSPGTFIYHTLEPNILCKVHFEKSYNLIRDSDNHYEEFGDFTLELLRPMPEDKDGNRYGDKIRVVLNDMARWLVAYLENERLLAHAVNKIPKLAPHILSLKPYIRTISKEFIDFHFGGKEVIEKFNNLLIDIFPKRDVVSLDSGKIILRGAIA